ncbi:MAG: hypothetical protein JO292_02280 [Betaproteobacteria bacterium]|nr:hypothetical protein [Betaproteobacteria bacterium]MBV9360195.1 hypothetical protein [Betaproteobacteria bacterium]
MKKYLCLLLLAGCSTVQWEKPGATGESIDADLRSCNAAVYATPGIPSPRTTSNSPEVRTSPTAGVSVQSAGSYGDADKQLQQGQRIDDCMKSRGYTLKAG